MAARSNAAATESGTRELVIARVFNAPRALVWKALTEPDRLEQWWGPKGFTTRVHKLELRPGGTWLYSQRTPDGLELFGKWVYREIVAPERLVSVASFTDAKGDPARNPFEPNWPLEMLSTATFTEHEGCTTITVRTVPVNATESERKSFEDGLKSMEQGFGSAFDRLDEYLASV
jgi:uncharacterized protein YndB with AHSA1/START domain